MIKPNDVTFRTDAVTKLLEKMSSCMEEINAQLEQLMELREDAEGELEAFSDESGELISELAQWEEMIHHSNEQSHSLKEEQLRKLFLFDSITPMTPQERMAVYQMILSGENASSDICSEAGVYLKEYRQGWHQSSEALPFDTNADEVIASLL